jgi:hypothetical protein
MIMKKSQQLSSISCRGEVTDNGRYQKKDHRIQKKITFLQRWIQSRKQKKTAPNPNEKFTLPICVDHLSPEEVDK